MAFAPGFGLPDLMSPISDLRAAVADLEAHPSNPLRDGQLAMLRQTLADREAGMGGPFQAPTTQAR